MKNFHPLLKLTQVGAFTTLLVMLLVFASSCGEDGKDGSATKDAQPTQADSSFAQQAYLVADSSHATWVGRSIKDRHHGRLPFAKSSLSVQNGQVTKADFVIDVKKISVAHPEDKENATKLRNHLLSVDFFDAERFPTASFELTSSASYDTTSTKKSDLSAEDKTHRTEDPTHVLTGNLSIRGTEREVSFPARLEFKDDQLTAVAKFNIDRTEFGIKYGDESAVVDKIKDQFIYNKVHVGFVVYARAQAATDVDAVKDTVPATEVEAK